MKTPSWMNQGRTKNNHEASGSSSQRFGLPFFLRGTSLPPPPRPEDFQGRPVEDYSPSRERRTRKYFRIAACERRWREGRGIKHTNVSLPTGWHLNRDCVPVPPVPKKGKGLGEEIHRLISNLPPTQRWEGGYRSEAYQVEFLEWEHKVRRATTILHDLLPGEVYPVLDIDSDDQGAVDHSEAKLGSEDGNDEEEDDDIIVKQEVVDDVAKNLPPEYREVLARGYDEDAFTKQAIAASTREEEAQWAGFEEAVRLTGLVAQENTQLPPPPPLPGWAPQVAPEVGMQLTHLQHGWAPWPGQLINLAAPTPAPALSRPTSGRHRSTSTSTRRWTRR